MIHELVAEDVHVLTGEQYGSSAVAIEMGSDILLIDGFGCRKDVGELEEWLDERGSSVKFIVATHYFSDHMAALGHFPDAEIIAHRNYRHTWESEAWRSSEETEHFIEPTILVDESLTLRWGRFDLDLFYNPGHTMSTLNIDIPGADLLHVADTVVGNLVYLFYSNPASIRDALVRISQRRRGTLMTSHGGPRSMIVVDHAIHYLDQLESYVRQARLADRPHDAILAIELDDCFPSGVRGSGFERVFHRRNLETILERRFFQPARIREKLDHREHPQVQNCG